MAHWSRRRLLATGWIAAAAWSGTRPGSRRATLAAETASATTRRPLLVASTTQVADLARQVVGDRCEVKSILAPGQDPHVYEIKPGDVRLVAQAELCLENGWHLEGKDWMRGLAESASRPLVTCAEGCEPLEIEHEGETSGESFHDPHAWFTPRHAAIYVRNILRGLVGLFPARRDEFEARAELCLEGLRALHQWIERRIQRVPQERRVLVTSHDAFGYFCREYGVRAASPAGWSTGDELGAGATAERRRAVVESIREFGVPAIFVETSVNPRLIEQIAADAGVRIGGQLYSDSMGAPGSAGETYVGMLRENVLTITEALR